MAKELHEKMKEFRELLAMDQEQMRKLYQVPYRTYRAWENGTRSSASAQSIYNILVTIHKMNPIMFEELKRKALEN